MKTTETSERMEALAAEVEYQKTNAALGRPVDHAKLFEVFAEFAYEAYREVEEAKDGEEYAESEKRAAEDKADEEEKRADAAEERVSELESEVEDLEQRIAELEREVERPADEVYAELRATNAALLADLAKYTNPRKGKHGN